MTKDGATLAVDPSSLIGNLFALLPIPVAVVDVRGEIVMSNSTFNDFFPETKNINRLPRYEVQVEGRATFDFDTVPLTDQDCRSLSGGKRRARDSSGISWCTWKKWAPSADS